MKLKIKGRLIANRKIDDATGCWLWQGARNSDGYGNIKYKRKCCLVHRVAYEQFIGPIKDRVLHKRECPNRNCFNPEHLYDGDQSDNNSDAYANGRIPGWTAYRANKELNK